MAEAIAFAIQAAELVKELLSVGTAVKDVMDMIDKNNSVLKKMQDENRNPSVAELDALNDESNKLRASRPDV